MNLNELCAILTPLGGSIAGALAVRSDGPTAIILAAGLGLIVGLTVYLSACKVSTWIDGTTGIATTESLNVRQWLRSSGSVWLMTLTPFVAFGITSFVAPKLIHDLEETERRGSVVVTALEQYHADRGSYPAFLSELTPQYLQDIPRPTLGLREWIYSSAGNSFQIQVNESVNTGNGDALWFQYLGEKDGWQTGD